MEHLARFLLYLGLSPLDASFIVGIACLFLFVYFSGEALNPRSKYSESYIVSATFTIVAVYIWFMMALHSLP